MATREYEGRSGRLWAVQDFRHRPGYLRPSATERPAVGRSVEMVRATVEADQPGETFGALRSFRSRSERQVALDLLAVGSPTTPVTLDVVDDARLPPALVTSWAAGSSDLPLERFHHYDDLGRLLDEGHRFTPAQALRTVVSLGQVLDAAAARGCTPIELSPDHLIYNRGSIRLVGIARHLYRPAAGEIPDPCGMSLPTSLLLGEDYPGSAAGPAVWRKAQIRALLRLVGWMTCGLAPGAWGRVSGDADLRDYLLDYAGLAVLPRLHEGSLADDLAQAAQNEEQQEGRRRLAEAKAVVLYDARACRLRSQTQQEWVSSLRGQVLSGTVEDVSEIILSVRVDVEDGADPWTIKIGPEYTKAANLPAGARIDLRGLYRKSERLAVRIDKVGRSSTGWPPVGATVVAGAGRVAGPRARNLPTLEINPEAVRLGLMVEHGDAVVAIAAIRPEEWTQPQATTLSGAGWLLVEPNHLGPVARRLASHLPDTRFVIAGRSPAAVSSLAGRRVDVVDPSGTASPQIAGRPATALPYLRDTKLDEFAKHMADPGMTRVARRRTFAAGWALAWDQPVDGAARPDLRGLLRVLSDQFGNDTELLLRVRLLLNKPVFGRDSTTQIRANVRKAAPILGGMPPDGLLREHLMTALLTRSTEDLYDPAKKRLLPVATRLAEVYDPELSLGGRTMDQALRDPDGIERLGLFGRLVTALPQQDAAVLADVVSALDDPLVRALRDIPAPSLQHLADRLGSAAFREALRQYADAEDVDLLDRYTPAAWEVLLSQTRGREQIGALGLGWSLIVDRDHDRAVDPRAVLDVAAAAGVEPRHVVRLLLDVPAADWRTVMENRHIASAWLREFDSLDIAGVLRDLPGTESLVDRYGARITRAGHLGGLSADQLGDLCDLAGVHGIEPDEVITTYLRLDVTADLTDRLTSVAGIAWTQSRIARGATFLQCVRRLADKPDDLRIWAVDGRGLDRRVLGDLLGDDLLRLGVSTAEAKTLFAMLTDLPGLDRLLGRVIFPRQRLALLRLLDGRPDRHRWPALMNEPLTALLDDEDPDGCLHLMLTVGLSLAQVRVARKWRLNAPDLAVLRALGPLAAELADDQVAALLSIGQQHGLPSAVTTAIITGRRSAAPGLVETWGPRWLPILAGPQGEAVADILGSAGLRTSWPHEVSDWLIAAGTNGLRSLRRHGERLLRVIAANRPPVSDVQLIDALLSAPDWPVDRLYPLIVRNGLPSPTWERAARRLRENWEENDILVELWCTPAARAA